MGRISDLVKLGRDTAYRLRTRGRDDFPSRRSLPVAVILERALREANRIALRHPSVIVVSLPKSGRTWLRFMLDQLSVHLDYRHPESLAPVPKAWRRKKIVYLHRDPRDVLVSLWFFEVRRLGRPRGSLSDLLASPEYGLESLIRTNLAWKKALENSGKALLLRYEDLHADTAGELGRVLRFVGGRNCAEEAIAKAVEEGRFEAMRALEESGEGAGLYGEALEPGDPSDPETYKVRRGKAGGWRDYFAPGDIEKAQRLLDRYDYFRRMGGGSEKPSPPARPAP